jgi:hypothetical protein
MSATDWDLVTKKIATLKDYLKTKKVPHSKVQHACFISKEEIERLLQQKGTTHLDGIRIYLGAELHGDDIVPNIAAVVACEKTGENKFDDFNVPESYEHIALKVTAGASTTQSGTATTMPCPSWCSTKNIINS